MVEGSLKVHCTDSSIMKFSAEPSSSACAHAHSEEAIRNEKAKAARPARAGGCDLGTGAAEEIKGTLHYIFARMH